MKQHIVLLAIQIWFDFSVQSQTSEGLFLNWGLVGFGDSILVDQSEILIGEWLDYVYYHDAKEYPSYIGMKSLTASEKAKLLNSEMIDSLLPDLSVIGHLPQSYLYHKCSYKKLIKFSSIGSKVLIPVNADSLRNRKSKERLMTYLRTPVTGLTFDQVMRFCEWRTQTDSLKFYVPPQDKRLWGDIYVVPLRQESYVFSLPTQAEFDSFNPNQDSLASPDKQFSAYNYKNANYKSGSPLIQARCGHSLMERGLFWQLIEPRSTAHDLQGNAAEMTLTPGIAMGGSYFHPAFLSMRGRCVTYTKPEPWLGFRCVARRRTN